jgi:hypothetical protein
MVVYTYNDSLYATPITSASPVKIDTEVFSDEVRISPDSTMVVYRKNSWGGPGNYELYSSPITISSPLLIDTGVYYHPYMYWTYWFQITPNSTRVVYWKGYESYELYSSPIRNRTPIKIDQDVNWYGITPDGARIVYMKGYDLYFRVVDGSKKARAIDDYVGSYVVSPDGSFLIYSRFTEIYPQSMENGMFRVEFPPEW